MAINVPILRAQPEGDVCLHSHNSLTTRQCYISVAAHTAIGAMQQKFDRSILSVDKTITNMSLEMTSKLVLMKSEVISQACSYDPFCLAMCEWTKCPGLGGTKANVEIPPSSNVITNVITNAIT